MNLEALASLLEHRLQVIANHELRQRNPEEQFQQLRTVSESIMSAHEQLRGRIDPRLNHYLTQASYDKALAHIRGLGGTQVESNTTA